MRNRPTRDPVGPGQESVWDYPRPPALEPSTDHVTIEHHGIVIAESRRPWRILETAHAPAYYLPAADVRTDLLRPSRTRTVCEYKGPASYADLVLPDGTEVRDAFWWYANPTPGYEAIAGAISCYPQRLDACTVNGERVTPLASAFYGDWPTSRIAGPYKGAPGTEWW